MLLRRLGALTLILAALTGCEPGRDGSAAPAATPTVAPATQLANAAATLVSTPHRFTLTSGGFTVGGAADPAAKALTLSTTAAGISAEAVILDKDYYAKITGIPLINGIEGGKWLHLDGNRVTTLARFGIGDLNDPGSARLLIRTAATVERDGDSGLKGTFDLTIVGTLAGQNVKAMGERAKAVPFTARLDASGRLAALSLTVDGKQKYEVGYSDYGTKVPAARPAPGTVVEAPEFVYRFLNN